MFAGAVLGSQVSQTMWHHIKNSQSLWEHKPTNCQCGLQSNDFTWILVCSWIPWLKEYKDSFLPNLGNPKRLCLLSDADFIMVINALVTSRLTCCNMLCLGLMTKATWKLQLMHLIMSKIHWQDYITTYFCTVHWLPITFWWTSRCYMAQEEPDTSETASTLSDPPDQTHS